MDKGPESRRTRPKTDEDTVRKRILETAFAAFVKNGYASTSTLTIATGARVSKRELYALVGTKREMLMACIRHRAQTLSASTDLEVPSDHESLKRVLTQWGTRTLSEISDPTVVAIFRLAISEALAAPEVAQTLDSLGRGPTRAALIRILAVAASHGLLDGDPSELGQRFLALLWGDLMMTLLLGVTARPSMEELAQQARTSVEAFLRLYRGPETN